MNDQIPLFLTVAGSVLQLFFNSGNKLNYRDATFFLPFGEKANTIGDTVLAVV
jgi:hypothetical protein